MASSMSRKPRSRWLTLRNAATALPMRHLETSVSFSRTEPGICSNAPTGSYVSRSPRAAAVCAARPQRGLIEYPRFGRAPDSTAETSLTNT